MKTLLILSMTSVIMSTAVQFRDCGSRGTIRFVDIPACTSDPCQVHRGDQIVGNMSLTVGIGSDSLTCAIEGLVEGVPVPVPYPCPIDDGCSTLLQGECPVYPGDKILYTFGMDILDTFPQVNAVGRWILNGDDGLPVSCFEVDVQVVA